MPFALKTAALSLAVLAAGLAGVASSVAGDGVAPRAAAERFDISVNVSVTRHRVPRGGTLRGVLKVTNRGNVRVPTSEEPLLAFGQALNRPGQPNYPGKAKYAYVRGPGKCSWGQVGSGSLWSFACDVIRLAPGESQKIRFKIKDVERSLLLDPGGFYGQSGRIFDDNRRNDEDPTIIRMIRR